MSNILLLRKKTEPVTLFSDQVPGVDISDSFIPNDTTLIKERISVRNGGGPGTTDWTNPTSGLAQYWNNADPTATFSIQTGSGFTGNAQQVLQNGAVNYPLQSDDFDIVVGKSYQLSLNYLSTVDMIFRIRNASDNDIKVTINALSNTGNAIETTSIAFVADESSVYVEIIIDESITGGESFTVDDIRLTQV